MDNKIAVIGDSESIKGFAAIGFETIECDKPERANHILRNTAEADVYSIIYMTEEMFLACEKERKKYEDKSLPAIIPIPGLRGNTGIGRQRLSDFVERAVGSDIIFNN
jgi:V/A-type H+-transporting ATPase subunit F